MFFSRYYEIVVMKLNKTSLVRKPTHSFENLSTYEEAGFNQPYVTAVLEPNYFENCDIRNFTIGMSTSFNRVSLNICSSMKVEVFKFTTAMAFNEIRACTKYTKKFH